MNKEDEAKSIVRLLVWAGFDGAQEMVWIIEEQFHPGEIKPDWLRAEIDRELGEKRLQEATWPAVTDCDRLDRVFEALEAQHIIVAQNAGLTKSDGLEDVTEEYEEEGGEDSEIEGFCYYHGQDLQRAMESNYLCLGFGAFGGDEAKTTEIGHRIRQALEEAGFPVEWDGTPWSRLLIKEMRWQRRSPTY